MSGVPLIDYDKLLDTLEHEGTMLAGAVVDGDHDRPVPGCPGLTLGETARHVGSVYRMVVAWIRSGDRPSAWQRQPHDGQPVEDYVRDGLRSLLGELATHDPAEGCATWHNQQQHYGFWRRRMAHESTVHRIDVQAAGGQDITPVDPDVAVDGVDEVLHLWFTHRLAVLGVAGTRSGTVAVRTADRVWMAALGPRTTSAWRSTDAEAESADAVVAADPTELYLWLWGRRAVFDRAVTLDGDLDVSAQLWALLRLATR
ncbi:maleylpyruvate isomerase N-terminal domain-containing protein [Actinokineospora sp. HUAS TT18]|uniref:maleylpyruvate isomerase N-terminal domain-containing protein n=1 Tax=Actinokineospora sp. HUAS TT18 TaxID=3447451 RepID=UPI003F51CF3F